MFNKKLLLFAYIPLLSLFSSNAYALAVFLEEWRERYPGREISDINCQVCHIGREGGSPWNAYGQDIREALAAMPVLERNIAQAFIEVESLNSDDDEPEVSNIEEINNDTQPGWRPGRVNNAFDRNGFNIGVFNQPITVDPISETILTESYPLEMIEIATGFTSPVGGVVGPTAALRDQFFILDQIGVIWRVDVNTGEKSIYIDIADRLISLGVFNPGGYDERGLLGFAFHPKFVSNGLLYLYLSEPVTGAPDFTTLDSNATADHQSVVLELSIANVSAISGLAEIDAIRELLRIDQPQFNHNGGALIFDSKDYLYISLGDGGNADDQGLGHGDFGNGSDPSNPLGSILRIDPLGNNSSNGAYGIPSDNPFIGQDGFLNEIYAYGFRNPWKLSFDQNGDLYAADVGQNDIEEINLVEKGQHYGWPIREGGFFFDNNGEFSGILTTQIPPNFPPVNLIDPLLQYDHDEGISVAGGFVYRGSRNPTLKGQYIFGESFERRIFVGNLNSGEVTAMSLEPGIFIYSFMQDSLGELYFMGNETAETSGSTGKLIKLQSTFMQEDFCFPIVAKNKSVSVVCL